VSPDTDVYQIGLPLYPFPGKGSYSANQPTEPLELRLLHINHLVSAPQNDPDLFGPVTSLEGI